MPHHQRKVLVLFKKKKDHGTQLNLEQFLMLMLRKLLKSLLLRLKTKAIELLPTDFWITTISERLSTRKPELLLDKLPCKEVAHHLNMEEVIGLNLKQEKQVLLKKKKKHHHHGTQLHQEKFSMLMLRRLLQSLLLRLKTKIPELPLTDFWITTISERHSMRKPELLLEELQ